jgi:hypothetical protein
VHPLPGPVLSVLLVLLAVLAGGCSVGDPETIGRSGIDGLEVPTASPDPADFVDGVDNPWLPWQPDRTWSYRVTEAGIAAGTVEVTVADGTRQVAGVEATVVREVTRDDQGRRTSSRERWYAQDTGGHVWLLGEAGRWEAGVDGARAGLAMPATPRTGDGWELAAAPGVAEERLRVLGVDASVTVPAGSWDGVVEVVETSPLRPEVSREVAHARDVGVVRWSEGAGRTVELVASTR